MDAHESLCTERHKTLKEKLDQAASERQEIKNGVHKIEARMWSVITAAAFAMLSVIVALVGGILVYLSNP